MMTTPVEKLFRGIWLSGAIAVLLMTACGGSGEAARTTRMLWLGSSSTYVHDLPLQTAKMLAASDKFGDVQAFLMGRSGTGFHVYLRDGFEAQYGLKDGQTLLDKIRDEPFDYTVIQQITYFIADSDSAEIMADTELLCDAIRAAGGEPVFYEMGWRTEPLNETGRQMILQEAKKHNVRLYSPCSSAWTRVWAERPDIELFNLPDRDHPGTLGTYLNICCFYAAITGQSPIGLSTDIEVWPRFGSFEIEEARRKLTGVQFDYYYAAMPDWMQAISNLRRREQIPPDIAKYFQNVAWETWMEKQQYLQ